LKTADRAKVLGMWLNFLIILVVWGCFLPPAARALDLKEWVPGLRLTPSVTEGTEYEANVFQARSHAQHDIIIRTNPGMVAEYKIDSMSLNAGYRAEILRFLERQSQDTVHHLGLGQFSLELPRLRLSLGENFTSTSDPPNSELTGRIKSTTNVLTPNVEYRLTERFSIGANYTWTRVEFPTVPQLDRDEQLAGGSVFWKFLPKADLGLNYSHGEKRFTSVSDRDVTENIAGLSLRGDLTAKISSTFSAGVQRQDPQQSGQRSVTGLIMGGGWNYRPSERTTVALATNRSLQESTFGNGKVFVSTVATLSVTQSILSKLTGTARLTVGENEYPTKETVDGQTKWRNDILATWGGTVNYEIQRWLRLGLDFSHTTRRSNFNDFSFSDDKIGALITVQF